MKEGILPFFKWSSNLEQKGLLKIGGSLLLRNTCLNFLGQVLPGLAGLTATPFLIRGLGLEAFGIFSLALVVLGYLGLFDLGLGAATTKYVAESMATGDRQRLTSLVWTSMAVQLSLGAVVSGESWRQVRGSISSTWSRLLQPFLRFFSLSSE